MQEDQDRSRRRKALWLLLALLVLGLAGGVFVAIDDDKPGSDVLGLKVPPTTEPSGAAGGSGVSPGTPAGGTTKGGSSD
ncbi:MAG: hypothetical protein ACRDZ7_13495, partial [Acidimicrobiia bacterium]